MSYVTRKLAAASVILMGSSAAYAQQLPAGYIGRVQGNTPNTWQTYTYTYTPSTSGANFVGFAFRQDPAFWTFDNAVLTAAGSNVNLFTNGTFSSGGAVNITTNNGPSQIQAPTNWGVWYQNGTYPAAAGTWNGGAWYDGAVGTFDGIYQGVNLDAGVQYTISFDVSGNHTSNNSSVQLGVYAGLCQDTTLSPASCTIPSSYGFTTLATPSQAANAGNPTPTLVSSNTVNNVVSTVAAPTYTSSTVVTHASSESGGRQTLNFDAATTVTATVLTTTTTTPVTTDTYSDNSTVVSNGTPVVTTSSASQSAVSHQYADFSGRIDQLEVLDGISGSINGTLDHEPLTNHKKRFRVFENTRLMHSYNADGYEAKSTVFGGGFEYDLTKGWTAGAQYNSIYSELLGVDSLSHLTRQHVGIFNSFHGRDVALVTNAGGSQDKYDVARTVEYLFGNWSNTEGTQWWVHNRLYLNNSGWFKPFLGYTVSNVSRNAYTETGSPESARSVEAFNQTTHVGEAGLKLETRFGGKKHNLFGVSVEGGYSTDSSYNVAASLDYKEVLFVEGSHGVNDGITNNSVAAKVKFRF